MRGVAAWQLDVRPAGVYRPDTRVIVLDGEIARTADALRLLAETLKQQPDAIWRGKRQKTAP